MAHKTVVIPSKMIVPFAAFTTDNTVRIIGKDIRLRPWGRRWWSIGSHQELHRLRVLVHGLRRG